MRSAFAIEFLTQSNSTSLSNQSDCFFDLLIHFAFQGLQFCKNIRFVSSTRLTSTCALPATNTNRLCIRIAASISSASTISYWPIRIWSTVCFSATCPRWRSLSKVTSYSLLLIFNWKFSWILTEFDCRRSVELALLEVHKLVRLLLVLWLVFVCRRHGRIQSLCHGHFDQERVRLALVQLVQAVRERNRHQIEQFEAILALGVQRKCQKLDDQRRKSSPTLSFNKI
jgi:hypothetical protein